MSTSKQIFILILQMFLPVSCFAQREIIDSLKRFLPSLHDSARIDCLNELSEAYKRVQLDTAGIYALQAWEEAEKINYSHGRAVSTSLNAGIAIYKYNDFSAAEKLAREAIYLYSKSTKKKGLNRAYFELGHALYARGYF